MNKALLLVVCDFLLISLLALVKVEDVKDPNESMAPDPELVTDAGPQQDMIDALQSSLDEERQAREALNQRLQKAETDLEDSRAELVEKAEEMRKAQEEIARRAALAEQLAQEQVSLQEKLQASQQQLTAMQQSYDASQNRMAELQREYASTRASLQTLEKNYEGTQTRLDEVMNRYQSSQQDIEALQMRLVGAQSEARINQQLVQQLEQDLRVRVAENSDLQGEIQQLDEKRQEVVAEKQKIQTQLQVVDTERRLTENQLQTARQEIASVREEKMIIQKQATELATNVSDLADQSENLTQEIRQSRPLTPNTIFSEFTSNRVYSTILASRSGLFGKNVKKDSTVRSVFFKYEGQIYAVYHLADTPFEYSAVGTEWESIVLTLRREAASLNLPRLGFLDRDPRIIIAPVTAEQASQMGANVYAVSSDLFKFQEAVLVGVRDSYYGECSFMIDPETPGYMRMQRERFGKLFGKFVPSQGDLVFSKTGELIGIMANNDYCLVFDNLRASRTIELGPEVSRQMVAAYFSQMHFRVEDLPGRLK